MKKPNFKKWAEKKKQETREHIEAGRVSEAYKAASTISKELGKRYERQGVQDFKIGNSLKAIDTLNLNSRGFYTSTRRNFAKARNQYDQAAQGYEHTGDYRMAEKMYREAGKRDKADEMKKILDERRKSRLEQIGLSSLIVTAISALLLISLRLTGFSIARELDSNTLELAGVILFLLGISLFLVSKCLKKKSFITKKK